MEIPPEAEPPDFKTWDESKLYLARELHRVSLILGIVAADVRDLKDEHIAAQSRRNALAVVWAGATTLALYLGKTLLQFLARHVN